MRYSYEFKVKCVEMGEYPDTPNGITTRKFRDTCKCQSKYVKKIQNKNVHFIHLPFGKNL